MKKTIILFALILILGVSAIGVYVAGPHQTAKKPAKAKTISAICPVMGTKISDVKKAVGKSVYKGKTYYFCCGGCKPLFDKNPVKYAGKKK